MLIRPVEEPFLAVIVHGPVDLFPAECQVLGDRIARRFAGPHHVVEAAVSKGFATVFDLGPLLEAGVLQEGGRLVAVGVAARAWDIMVICRDSFRRRMQVHTDG